MQGGLPPRRKGLGVLRQWQPAQEVFLQPPQPDPPLAGRPVPAIPKVEGWRSTRSVPQPGQATLVDELKTIVSKKAWQSWQRYS